MASGMSSATRRAYSPGSALLRLFGLGAPRHARPARQPPGAYDFRTAST